MRNVDKYKDELIKMTEESDIVQVSYGNNVIPYSSEGNGLFCSKRATDCFIKWLYEECTFELSTLELELLRYFYRDGYRYIARDKDNELFLYKSSPLKSDDSWVMMRSEPYDNFQTLKHFENLFSFVRWEDTQPIPIQDILDNCEVTNHD